jgi:hypothetical protein
MRAICPRGSCDVGTNDEDSDATYHTVEAPEECFRAQKCPQRIAPHHRVHQTQATLVRVEFLLPAPLQLAHSDTADGRADATIACQMAEHDVAIFVSYDK